MNEQQQPRRSPYVPYPGAQGGAGPQWQGQQQGQWQGPPQGYPPFQGAPPIPPPPRSGGKTGLIAGLAGAVVIAVVALVIVLVNNGGDNNTGGGTASPGGTHGTGGTAGGTGGGATAQAAQPSAHAQPARPKTAYEQVAFDYVSAVQNNDLASAQALACPSFRTQVKIAPLGLHSPAGVTVDKVDTFQLGGADAITDSDTAGTDGALIKANVGIRVHDGQNTVHWIFKVLPQSGQPRICGESVLDENDVVPEP